MSAHEVVIRLRRPFSVQANGKEYMNLREVTIPFADAASATAAAREITVEVRPVHDAGGEDYRTVVAGQVIREPAEIEAG